MRSPRKRREAITFYLFISPWLLGFLFFTLGPMVLSLYSSFTDWDLLTSPVWIGLQNYTDAFADALFYQSLKVTAIYTLLYVPLDLLGGLMLALLVNARMRGVRFFRTVFYLPTVFSRAPALPSTAAPGVWRTRRKRAGSRRQAVMVPACVEHGVRRSSRRSSATA